MAASHTSSPNADDALLAAQSMESDDGYVWLDEKASPLPKIDNTSYVHLYNALKFICPSYMLDLEEQRICQALRSQKRPAVINFLRVIEKIQKEVNDEKALEPFTKALDDLVEGAKRARREHKTYLQSFFQKIALLANFLIPGIAQATAPVAEYLTQVPGEVKKDGDALMEYLLSASGALEQIILVTTLALQAKKVGADLVELQRQIDDIRMGMTAKYGKFKTNFDVYAGHIISFITKIADERPKDSIVLAPLVSDEKSLITSSKPVEAKRPHPLPRIQAVDHHDIALAAKADAKTVEALEKKVELLETNIQQLNTTLAQQEAKLTASLKASFAETMDSKNSEHTRIVTALTNKVNYVENMAAIRHSTNHLRIVNAQIATQHRTTAELYRRMGTVWTIGTVGALTVGTTATGCGIYWAGGLTAAFSGPVGWILGGAAIISFTISAYNARHHENNANRLYGLDNALRMLEVSVSTKASEIKQGHGIPEAKQNEVIALQEHNDVRFISALRYFILMLGTSENSASNNCLEEIKLIIKNHNSRSQAEEKDAPSINDLKTHIYNKITALVEKEKTERYYCGLFPPAPNQKFIALTKTILDSDVFAEQKPKAADAARPRVVN